MRFASPALLALLWLVIPALLLFVFKRRPQRVRVSTLPFFKSLAVVYQESPWLRRLKKLLAVLFAVLTLVGIVFGLGRLIASPAAGSWNGMVVVLDASASMARKEADGRTRLDLAKIEIERRIAALGAGASILLMRYDKRPEIVVPHSLDRREFRRALKEVAPRPVAGDGERALRLAVRLAGMVKPARILHVTDQPFALPESEGDNGSEDATKTDTEKSNDEDDGDDGDEEDKSKKEEDGKHEGEAEDPRKSLQHYFGLNEDVELAQLVVGRSDAPNAGITAFSMRPLPLEHGRFEAFVELRGRGPAEEPLACALDVRLDKELVALREVSIPPDEAVRLLIPIEGQSGDTVQFHLKTKGDALASDDRVVAPLPPRKPLHVLWVRATPDPFTQIALQSFMDGGEVEGFEMEPGAWPYAEKPIGEDVDVVLFDGWLPSKWPSEVPAIVLRPPGTLGPIEAAALSGDGLPVDRLRAINQDHPLLYGVASERVALTQTSVLQGDGPMTPLWLGPNGPLLVAGDVRGQRVVVMGFSAERSESLPFTPAYPLLLGNAILWCCQKDDDPSRSTYRRTGDVLDLTEVEEGKREVRWLTPDPRGGLRETRTELAGALLELDSVGTWQVGERRGSAALLAHAETVPADASQQTPTDTDVAEASSWFQGDLRPHLLWLLLVLLIAEAWLFHRWSMF